MWKIIETIIKEIIKEIIKKKQKIIEIIKKQKIIVIIIAAVLTLVVVGVVSLKLGWLEIHIRETSREFIISDHAAAIILMTKDDNELPVIKEVSRKGRRFFGFVDTAKESPVGKSMDEILDRFLKYGYMDRDIYDKVKEDHERLFRDYPKEGQALIARQAIIFNDKHHCYEYRNKVFLPVVVYLRGKTKGIKGEIKQEYMSVLYLYKKHAEVLLDAAGMVETKTTESKQEQSGP